MVKGRAYTAFIVLAMLLLSPYVNSVELTPSEISETTGRAQTIWSGNIVLNNNYGVAVTDELVISACTNVTMASGVRIYVDGRLTVEGTKSCPVYFDYAGSGDHMGIQFNTSSNGRGSKIDNASIIHSTYGITIYGSNPHLANVTIFDADDVAVDLFNSATPTIRNLEINESGQDWITPQYWRYGIGLSVGAGSAPNVDGMKITNAVTRGLNLWGNSGGLYRNISIDNVTGAILAMSAGIWVEDSIPLLESVSVDKSDHGVIVRHITDGAITRAVIRDLDITNSMYVAMILDKEDRTNYTNYQSAVIDGLTISGTGGPSAKTPGLATATLEINATGAWIENSNIEDNSAVGVKLYFVDSTTIFSNLTINNSGGSGTGANAAGISVRSSYFAPTFNNLEVSNSTGPAVFSKSGGAIQGKDWNLHNNGQEGFFLDSASTIVENLSLSNNSDSGAHIYDARYVYLYNVSSENNGDAGLLFERANDIETTSGDVKCVNCSSKNDAKGVTIIDSVDLYLEGLTVQNPVTGSSIVADNGGLNIGVQGGRFHLKDVVTWQNSSLPAISIVSAEAEIDGLEMYGAHAGLHWDADHNQERNSILSNASLSGTDCLILSNHDQLYGSNINITNDCLGDLDFTNVKLNWTDLEDFGSHVLNVDTNSNLHLHQPVNIDYQSSVISGNGWIEEAWDIQVWVLNNNSNGVPDAFVELGFDQLESEMNHNTDDYGWASFPDLRGKKFTSVGESPYTDVTINCSYDGITNSTSTILDQDRVIWCHLPLANQAPFLIWDTPVDQTIFPSKSEVIFNASRSWDLDDDSLTFKWNSSIDGVLLEGTESEFTANEDGITNPLVNLSDGIHNIELEICDVDFCVSETRTIELANQPPLIVLTTDPALNPWGELISPITKLVHYNLSGTYDPENDSMTCSWSWLSST
ncbi:MAG: right-handed parallel beta-helix repeat-containing protein, partial [Euryarchaeota archaeon]